VVDACEGLSIEVVVDAAEGELERLGTTVFWLSGLVFETKAFLHCSTGHLDAFTH